MIFPVKRLIIENDGYKREVFLKAIYINSTKIISVTDYDGLTSFLLREKSELQDKSFSLIKLENVPEDIIALGSASQIYAAIREHLKGKELLNG